MTTTNKRVIITPDLSKLLKDHDLELDIIRLKDETGAKVTRSETEKLVLSKLFNRK
jgi:hypothetical protein